MRVCVFTCVRACALKKTVQISHRHPVSQSQKPQPVSHRARLSKPPGTGLGLVRVLDVKGVGVMIGCGGVVGCIWICLDSKEVRQG